MNGIPPFTRQEEDENNILVNVNWKIGTNQLHECRRMYENAFLKPGNYFKVNLEAGPAHKRADWSRIITRHINKPLKRSLAFMEAYRSKFAGVVLHGVGPMMWEDEWKWIPYTFGIEDLLIPTDTYTTLDNLYYFGVRKPMKPGELFRKTFGMDEKYRDPGWDMDAVQDILDSYRDLNQNPHQWNWSEHPEKMAELYKQNLTYYDSDSAPVIWFWDFYFQAEEDSGGKWCRRLMLDQDYVPAGATALTSPIKFIYEKDNFAEELGNILHIQFGDGSNKPPFMYHSVRSIGWMLYDVVSLDNRLRCQFTEHVFEQMMMLFKVDDVADRARLEKILLSNKGIMPQGASLIPAAERYQVDAALVNSLMSENRQIMAESTASYTNDVNDGTNKEKTATEVMAQVNSVNSLTATLINYAYLREAFAYREITRRLLLPESPEAEAKKVRMKCMNDGIPEKYLDIDYMEIEPERVLGGGNKMLEIAQAQQIMSQYVRLDPDSQREALRIFIGAATDNEQLANMLVPEKSANHVSDAQHDADLAFGTLMQGAQMKPQGGRNHIDQVEELLKLMAMKIQAIMKSGGVGTPQDVTGLETVAQYVNGHIQLIAQDKTEKKRSRQYAQTLGKLMNMVKAFAQRQQEAAKAQQNKPDPALQAKIQAEQQLNQIKISGKQAEGRQKLQLKAAEFQADQQRENQRLASEMRRDQLETHSRLANQALESAGRAYQDKFSDN